MEFLWNLNELYSFEFSRIRHQPRCWAVGLLRKYWQFAVSKFANMNVNLCKQRLFTRPNSFLFSITIAAPLRASQADEAVAMVRFLRVSLGLELLSLVYDAAMADSVSLSAVVQACAQTGLALLGSPTSYSSSADLTAMLAQSSPVVPQAVVVIAASTVASQIVHGLRLGSLTPGVVIGVVTVEDAASLANGLGAYAAGVYISQVRGHRCFLDPLYSFETCASGHAVPSLVLQSFSFRRPRNGATSA